MGTVLVTGVSRERGIGAAVAARLRADGHTVVTAGWTPYDHEVLPAVAEQAGSDFQFDLGVPDAPAELIDTAVARVGQLTALVAVHTVDTGGGLEQMTAELIDRHLNVNVRGTLLLMAAFVAQLGDPAAARQPVAGERMAATPARGGGTAATPGTPGRIVIFTSGPPQSGATAYAASKGALEWITYSAATELGPRGITVNAINPGPNQTGWMTPRIEADAIARTPLGRTGQPADAAALVSILLSDDAAFINGQVIASDGGYRVAQGA